MPGSSGTGAVGSLSLGEVVRAALPDFSGTHRLPAHHWKVLRAIAACRTAALGGHQYRCARCGNGHFVPHSCGNRHCTQCQGINGAEWLVRQQEHLLPIPYFHVVFTLPHEFNPLIRHNQQHSIICSSPVPPQRSWSSERTTSKPSWASPPFSTPGAKISGITTICIASSPVVGSP
jgi:hypothetical protein